MPLFEELQTFVRRLELDVLKSASEILHFLTLQLLVGADNNEPPSSVIQIKSLHHKLIHIVLFTAVCIFFLWHE